MVRLHVGYKPGFTIFGDCVTVNHSVSLRINYGDENSRF